MLLHSTLTALVNMQMPFVEIYPRESFVYPAFHHYVVHGREACTYLCEGILCVIVCPLQIIKEISCGITG